VKTGAAGLFRQETFTKTLLSQKKLNFKAFHHFYLRPTYFVNNLR
jgi:hypothetical protein